MNHKLYVAAHDRIGCAYCEQRMTVKQLAEHIVACGQKWFEEDCPVPVKQRKTMVPVPA